LIQRVYRYAVIGATILNSVVIAWHHILVMIKFYLLWMSMLWCFSSWMMQT